MARIDFTDTIGAASLASPYPAPANRFLAQQPDYAHIGPRSYPMGGGPAIGFRFRGDDLLTLRIPGLRLGTEHDTALRLKAHLLSSGATCSLVGENVAATTYTAYLAPGSDVTIEGPDEHNEYTFSATFANNGAGAMRFVYP